MNYNYILILHNRKGETPYPLIAKIECNTDLFLM